MKRLYGILLRLYPVGFREEYASEHEQPPHAIDAPFGVRLLAFQISLDLGCHVPTTSIPLPRITGHRSLADRRESSRKVRAKSSQSRRRSGEEPR